MTFFLQRLALRAMGLRSSVRTAARLYSAPPILREQMGVGANVADGRLARAALELSPRPEAFHPADSEISLGGGRSVAERLSVLKHNSIPPSAPAGASPGQAPEVPQLSDQIMQDLPGETIASVAADSALSASGRARVWPLQDDGQQLPKNRPSAGGGQEDVTQYQNLRASVNPKDQSLTPLVIDDATTPFARITRKVSHDQSGNSPPLSPARPLLPLAQARKESGATLDFFPGKDSRPGGAVEETTEIHVTIGRIDLTAVYEPGPEKQVKTSRRPQPMSLDDYLSKRQGRRI